MESRVAPPFLLEEIAMIMNVRAFSLHSFCRAHKIPVKQVPGKPLLHFVDAKGICENYILLLDEIERANQAKRKDYRKGKDGIEPMMFRDVARKRIYPGDKQDIIRVLWASYRSVDFAPGVKVSTVYRCNKYRDRTRTLEIWNSDLCKWERIESQKPGDNVNNILLKWAEKYDLIFFESKEI